MILFTKIVQVLYLDNPAVENEDLYRIGTVASLTGISVERLRAWERRYDLSPAHKSGKTRFYSKDQLERLKLIKHLIDQGQPISTLAGLDHNALLARIEIENPPVRQLEVAHQPKVGLIGPNLLMLEQQVRSGDTQGSQMRLDVVSRWANMDAFTAEQLAASDEPQVIVLQAPVLSPQPIDLIKDIYENAHIVVVYQFASSTTLSKLEADGLPILKWPVTWSEIEHVAISEIGLPRRATQRVARRYSDEELIALASELSDDSQCPQYLIEAIHQLNAFTDYASDSAQTADRPRPFVSLSFAASQSRALLEQALDDLIDAWQN